MDGEKTTTPVSPHRFVVRAEEAGKRLDLALAERIPELSRRRARVLISAGSVSVDGRRVLIQSRLLAAGQEVLCVEQRFARGQADALDPARILHEDDCLIAIDKPQGVPSHPTFARKLGTALQLTEEWLRRREGKKVLLWPLHRLDTATSGVLLFAKTKAAARAVNQNFARRRVAKRYVALVSGVPSPASGEIRLALSEGNLRTEPSATGKDASTRYRVIEEAATAALVELEPMTGRMHQIRVHLAAIGHPVVGDGKYGRPTAHAPRLMLHASRLELPHPRNGASLVVESALPEDFTSYVETLRS